jgi:hypothetical protein
MNLFVIFPWWYTKRGYFKNMRLTFQSREENVRVAILVVVNHMGICAAKKQVRGHTKLTQGSNSLARTNNLQ